MFGGRSEDTTIGPPVGPPDCLAADAFAGPGTRPPGHEISFELRIRQERKAQRQQRTRQVPRRAWPDPPGARLGQQTLDLARHRPGTPTRTRATRIPIRLPVRGAREGPRLPQDRQGRSNPRSGPGGQTHPARPGSRASPPSRRHPRSASSHPKSSTSTGPLGEIQGPRPNGSRCYATTPIPRSATNPSTR